MLPFMFFPTIAGKKVLVSRRENANQGDDVVHDQIWLHVVVGLVAARRIDAARLEWRHQGGCGKGIGASPSLGAQHAVGGIARVGKVRRRVN